MIGSHYLLIIIIDKTGNAIANGFVVHFGAGECHGWSQLTKKSRWRQAKA